MSTLPTTRYAWTSPTAGRSRYLWSGFLGCSTQQRSNGTIGKSLLPGLVSIGRTSTRTSARKGCFVGLPRRRAGEVRPRTPNGLKQQSLRDVMALVQRRLAYPVSGRVSVFGWRPAVGVLRERVRLPLCTSCTRHVQAGRWVTLSASWVAHTNTLTRPATRPTRLAYHLDVPPLSNRSVL